MEKLTASFGFRGNDGISPTIETSKESGVTTLTITDVEGTKTAEILDGKVKDGVPTNSVIGFKGSTSEIPAGYEITDDTFGGGGGETLKIGTILPFSGTVLPAGYLLCDGSAVSRTDYADLFVVIGTKYGEGDGTTTFNLPNLKGRVPVGLDNYDTDFDDLGNTGGEKTHTLTVNEMPSHNHQIGSPGYGSSTNNSLSHVNNDNVFRNNSFTGNTGGGQSHNNLQPYLVINYIIKASQTAPVNGQIINGYTESQTDAYSANYVNSLRLKKLWENPSPSSVFAAQTITLSSSDYDYLIWIFGSYKDNIWQQSYFSIGSFSNIAINMSNDYGVSGTYYLANYHRNITISNNIEVLVSNCTIKYDGNTSDVTDNDYLIPLMVYGGKF